MNRSYWSWGFVIAIGLLLAFMLMDFGVGVATDLNRMIYGRVVDKWVRVSTDANGPSRICFLSVEIPDGSWIDINVGDQDFRRTPVNSQVKIRQRLGWITGWSYGYAFGVRVKNTPGEAGYADDP